MHFLEGGAYFNFDTHSLLEDVNMLVLYINLFKDILFCKYFVISVEKATEQFHKRSCKHSCQIFAKQNVY